MSKASIVKAYKDKFWAKDPLLTIILSPAQISDWELVCKVKSYWPNRFARIIAQQALAISPSPSATPDKDPASDP